MGSALVEFFFLVMGFRWSWLRIFARGDVLYFLLNFFEQAVVRVVVQAQHGVSIVYGNLTMLARGRRIMIYYYMLIYVYSYTHHSPHHTTFPKHITTTIQQSDNMSYKQGMHRLKTQQQQQQQQQTRLTHVTLSLFCHGNIHCGIYKKLQLAVYRDTYRLIQAHTYQ